MEEIFRLHERIASLEAQIRDDHIQIERMRLAMEERGIVVNIDGVNEDEIRRACLEAVQSGNTAAIAAYIKKGGQIPRG